MTSTKKTDKSRSSSQTKTNKPDKTNQNITNPKTKKIITNLLIWIMIFFMSLVCVDYAVQYLNYNASVAIVNGERIYRKDLAQKLEDSYGLTVVNQLIDETLILQEATAQNITVSDEKMDDEISELEESYGGKKEFQAELDLRNISAEQLRAQIEVTLIVEEILGNDITVTEEEKTEFYEQYKDVLSEGEEDITFEDAEKEIEDTLIEQKISQKVQPWLVEIRDTANIKNNIEEPKGYSLLGITKEFLSSVFSK